MDMLVQFSHSKIINYKVISAPFKRILCQRGASRAKEHIGMFKKKDSDWQGTAQLRQNEGNASLNVMQFAVSRLTELSMQLV